jgi:hypothetical protein
MVMPAEALISFHRTAYFLHEKLHCRDKKQMITQLSTVMVSSTLNEHDANTVTNGQVIRGPIAAVLVPAAARIAAPSILIFTPQRRQLPCVPIWQPQRVLPLCKTRVPPSTTATASPTPAQAELGETALLLNGINSRPPISDGMCSLSQFTVLLLRELQSLLSMR